MTGLLSLTLFVCCLSTSLGAQSGTDADAGRSTTHKTDARIESLDLTPKQVKAMATKRAETISAMENLRSEGKFYVGSPELSALRKKERTELEAILTVRQRAALRVRFDGH